MTNNSVRFLNNSDIGIANNIIQFIDKDIEKKKNEQYMRDYQIWHTDLKTDL